MEPKISRLSQALMLSQDNNGEIHANKELSECLIRWATNLDYLWDQQADLVKDLEPLIKKIEALKNG